MLLLLLVALLLLLLLMISSCCCSSSWTLCARAPMFGHRLDGRQIFAFSVGRSRRVFVFRRIRSIVSISAPLLSLLRSLRPSFERACPSRSRGGVDVRSRMDTPRIVKIVSIAVTPMGSGLSTSFGSSSIREIVAAHRLLVFAAIAFCFFSLHSEALVVVEQFDNGACSFANAGTNVFVVFRVDMLVGIERLNVGNVYTRVVDDLRRPVFYEIIQHQ